MKSRLAFLLPFAAFFAPLIASAHEVYVLSPEQIEKGIEAPPFSMMDTMMGDLHHFMFWALAGAVVVLAVFFISISRRLERRMNPFFAKLRIHAPAVARVSLGISFLAAAYFKATFGPELPIAPTYGNLSTFLIFVLFALGICITFGFMVRGAALIALALFAISWFFHGHYMLTYANYLGEMLVLLILGAHTFGVQKTRGVKGRGLKDGLGKMADRLAPYSFLFLRVLFGVSLIYSALYAKFFHNMLALEVAQTPLAGHLFSVAHYLGFEPHFLVLGACIIEVSLGIFFILGIEIRFICLFIEFWLALSLFYFGESVWPHLILIGIPIAFIFYGYDKYSLEGMLFKRGNREPVL